MIHKDEKGLLWEWGRVKITSRKALLEDGRIVEYDLISETSDVYHGHTFIGRGTIHSINNIPQKGKTVYNVFKKNEQTADDFIAV